MKKLFLALTILLSITCFSQEITLEKGKYYVNGKQISTRETKQLLITNYKALSRFKSGLSKESTGGFLIGFGGALVVTDLVVGLVSDVNYPTIATYIGAGALIASIPILSGKNRKIKEGIDIYNEGLKNPGTSNSNLELNFIANQHGYGVQIRF
ncbi:hypothetical protein [Flavobacterium sp.]|uniref:hypothetical protein n=1 Tax=Flavobacterium sp. TaxID=239 RepID=UPI003753135F